MAMIEIDDALLAEALKITGISSAHDLLESELRDLVRRREAQLRVRELRGKIDWVGDLDEMRRDR